MRALFDPIVWSMVAPLAAACLTFVTRRGRTAIILATLVVTSGAAAGVVAGVHRQGARLVALGHWAPPLGIALRADGLSAFMIAVTTGVGVLVSVYAIAYLPVQHEAKRDVNAFWPLWFFAWLGLHGIYLSTDLFNLYIALEVLGISTVGLVALAGGEALAAAIRYALVTLLGSLFFVLGVALLYAQHGTVDIALLGQWVTAGPASWAALAFMTAGMAMKTALLPLHFWLPSAHASALGPVSALLSALVIKGSFYLILRLWIGVFPAIATVGAAGAVGLLGGGAIVWGSIQALRQKGLKRLVAYSTVAQVGYLFLILPLGMHARAGAAAWSGGMLLVATHACAKGAMFLAAGSLKHAFGTDDIASIRGLATRAPTTVFAFALAGVTLIGLPPTGGFLGKWMLLSAALATGQVAIALIIVAGSLLAAAYVFKPLERMLLAPPSEGGVVRRARIPGAMTTATLLLALAGVLLGLLSHAPVAMLGIGDPFAAAMDSGHTP
jgi:multicomponent Na+:H+ antiporter subunit D